MEKFEVIGKKQKYNHATFEYFEVEITKKTVIEGDTFTCYYYQDGFLCDMTSGPAHCLAAQQKAA